MCESVQMSVCEPEFGPAHKSRHDVVHDERLCVTGTTILEALVLYMHAARTASL